MFHIAELKDRQSLGLLDNWCRAV